MAQETRDRHASACASGPTTRGRSTRALANGAYDDAATACLRTSARGPRRRTGHGRRGCGAAAAPASAPARSGRSCRRTSFPRYLAVNGDEGEPSTFKDHMLVERDPHQLIEGIVIAVVRDPGATRVHLPARRVRARRRAARQALADAYAHGLPRQEHPRLGLRPRDRRCTAAPGATSPATRRGCCRASKASARCRASSRRSPRSQGVYAAPTIVNNVETMSTVPHIVRMGGEGYAELGVEPLDRHAHLLGVGSRRAARQLRGRARHHVPRPHRRPRGRRPRRHADRSSSSPAARRRRGCSTEHLDAPLDMDFVQTELGDRCSARARSWCSTTTVDPLLVAWRLAKFFAHESCGKCTPCREGSGWIEKVLYRMSHGLGRPRGPRPAARRSATTSRPGLNCAVRADDDLPARARARCRRSSASTGSSATRSRAHDPRHGTSQRARRLSATRQTTQWSSRRRCR